MFLIAYLHGKHVNFTINPQNFTITNTFGLLTNYISHTDISSLIVYRDKVSIPIEQ